MHSLYMSASILVCSIDPLCIFYWVLKYNLLFCQDLLHVIDYILFCFILITICYNHNIFILFASSRKSVSFHDLCKCW